VNIKPEYRQELRVPLDRSIALLLLCSVFAYHQPVAAQLEFGATAELEYLENPRRQSQADDEDLLSSVTAAARLQRQTQRVDTEFDYSAARYEYKNDSLSDETRINGSGSVVLKAIPDRLNWQISNLRANRLINAAEADITDNRQIIDQTSFGPSLTLPVGGVSFVSLTADHALINYEESEFLDQARTSYTAGFTRIISSRLNASLRSSYSSIEFDTIEAFDYSFLRVSGVLELTTTNYAIELEAGDHRTERIGVTSSNPVFRISASYNLNSRLALTAEYSDSVEDLNSDLRSARLLGDTQAGGDASLDSRFGDSNTANIYESERRSLGLAYSVPDRYDLSLRVSNNERNLLDSESRESDERITLNFRYPVGQRLTFTATAQRSRLDFSQAVGLQEREDYQLGLAFRLTDRVGLVFSAFDSEQDTETGVRDYESRGASLGLAFRR